MTIPNPIRSRNTVTKTKPTTRDAPGGVRAESIGAPVTSLPVTSMPRAASPSFEADPDAEIACAPGCTLTQARRGGTVPAAFRHVVDPSGRGPSAPREGQRAADDITG